MTSSNSNSLHLSSLHWRLWEEAVVSCPHLALCYSTPQEQGVVVGELPISSVQLGLLRFLLLSEEERLLKPWVVVVVSCLHLLLNFLLPLEEAVVSSRRHSPFHSPSLSCPPEVEAGEAELCCLTP
jgi:hypothetical protein